jgi:CelD/BcsL family acetyltransferase involved in cellulose biosynthesis
MDTTVQQQAYTVRVIRDRGELESVRPLWESMLKHPNADFDAFALVLQSRPDILHPYVLIVSTGGTPVSVVVARVENRRLECTVGYATVYRPRVRFLTVLYGGWMGDQSRAVADVVVQEFMQTLARREVDAVHINLHSDGSMLHAAARTSPPFFSRTHVVATQPHYRMDLPSNKSDLYKNMHRKHRATMRKKIEMIRRDFPDKVTLRRFTTPEDVARLCSDADSIEQKTYHRGLGIGFRNDPETQQTLSVWARRGKLLSYVLYVDEKPWSFAIGKIHDGAFYLDYIGYDPAHASYTPGIALLTNLFEDLCDTHCPVSAVDFGFGDADYKRRFCTITWQESSTYIFAPRLRPVFINVVRLGILWTSGRLKALSLKMNLEPMLKKIWRKKAEEKQEEHHESAAET